MEIHDCFVNTEDQLLYLLTNGNKKLFWSEEAYIPPYLLHDYFTAYSSKLATNDTGKLTCSVDKESQIPCVKKCRSMGVLVSAYNCGVINGYREIFVAESLSQVGIFILDLITHAIKLPKFLIYDNACHLESFFNNNDIAEKSERGRKIRDIDFVIDRLHIHNHVRADCHLYYNANLYDELFKVNTVVCEEINFWLSGFKHCMKHMNATRFNFFLFIIMNTYNIEKLKLNKKKFI